LDIVEETRQKNKKKRYLYDGGKREKEAKTAQNGETPRGVFTGHVTGT